MTTTNKEKTDWIINTELFKNESNPFDSEEKRRDRKFNLKIRSSDLELIDCLASEYQISRSVLINYLLNKGLIRDLLPNESSDGHSDLDVKVLIAHRADQKLEEK